MKSPIFHATLRVNKVEDNDDPIWIALMDSPCRASSPNPDGAHLLGFRYSRKAGDLSWMCCVKDGQTLVAVDSGIVVTDFTEYRLSASLTPEITSRHGVHAVLERAAAAFKINGRKVATMQEHLPNAELMGLYWPRNERHSGNFALNFH